MTKNPLLLENKQTIILPHIDTYIALSDKICPPPPIVYGFLRENVIILQVLGSILYCIMSIEDYIKKTSFF